MRLQPANTPRLSQSQPKERPCYPKFPASVSYPCRPSLLPMPTSAKATGECPSLLFSVDTCYVRVPALLSQIGVRSGEEFRAARRAAEGCDAQLVLGDRPIEVTLRRAWDALSLRQRWRLGRRLASRCACGDSPPHTALNAEACCCCKTQTT